MPAAMYRYILDPTVRNDNPVAVERRFARTTSKQVADYLLCASCEDLFNKNGEHWILRQVWNGRRFPLLDRLSVAVPHYSFPDVLAFSGTSVGVDTDKLGYFALSVLWRAAVHIWKTPFGGKTTQLDLGPSEEPIRRYLLGQLQLPNDIVVMVHVCTDRESRGSFYLPCRVVGSSIPSFGFMALGLFVRIYIGPTIPPTIREFCCVNSEKRLIFQRNCVEKIMDAFQRLRQGNISTT
jgi:hypothetical protein